MPQNEQNKEILAEDPEIKRITLARTKRNLGPVITYLEKIIFNKDITDEKLDKSGAIRSVAISHDTRLNAVKLWKELLIDKTIPDIKHHKTTGEKGGLIDTNKFLKEISKEMKAYKNRKSPVLKPEEQKNVIPATVVESSKEERHEPKPE